MQRASLFTVLVISALLAGTLQAQHGGGMIRGGAPREVIGSGFVGHPGVRSGFFPGSRFRNSRNNGVFYPPYLWYDEPFDYEQPVPQAMSGPPIMIVQAGNSQPATPQIPAASPKVIELSGATNSAASKPLPLAMFILTSGERLEAQRYLLTHDILYVTVDRQQRTIPLAMLDINATLAADHERGIELRVPADHTEISVSF